MPGEDYEDYEEEWDNEIVPAFVPWIDGVVPQSTTDLITVTAGNDTFRVRLWDDGANDFNEAIVVDEGTYTVESLVSELQAEINTALTAEGAPFSQDDIRVIMSPLDYARVQNNKSGYTLYLSGGSDDGWPLLLGREVVEDWDFRKTEAGWLGDPTFQWTGEHNSEARDNEEFERDWGNSEVGLPWEHHPTLADFIVNDEDSRRTSYVIAANTNDYIKMRYREWGTASVTSSGAVAVTTGTHTPVQLAAYIESVIDTWLAGAGAPFAAGQITVEGDNATGEIRVINIGGSARDFVFWLFPEGQADLWGYIGMPVDVEGTEETYAHPTSSRVPEYVTLYPAIFDTSPENYEDFEEDWP